MNTNKPQIKNPLAVTQAELLELFRPQGNPEGMMKFILVLVGLLLTPVTLLGALLFYRRGYSRFMEPENEMPRLHNLSPVVKVGMLIGAILIWAVLYMSVLILGRLLFAVFGHTMQRSPSVVLFYVGANILLTVAVFFWFNRWRRGIYKYMAEKQRYGSARFTTDKELSAFSDPEGLYIGNGLFYKKAGHLLTVAGTRAGKGVNLILPNLLMPGLFKGSWVCIDPKGELAAVSARVQREAGRKVVILNPWNLLGLGNSVFNPLDILTPDRNHLIDDIQLISEALVPTSANGDQDHFDSRARSFIAGIIAHLVAKAPKEKRHLGTLWQWLRLDHEEWVDLLAEMMVNDDPIAGDIVKATANEIASLMKTSDREYGSVMSSAQRHTDFIKSPALRESMAVSDQFASAELASGNVTVYVIIPADKLKSHDKWLRLVVTTLMQSVVRNPQKDVAFLLDEMFSLGYLSIIDIALGAYAGFGIHIWSILQNLGQLKKLYGDMWENFISSCSVRHFFSLNDNLTVEYVEKMFGQTSVPSYNEKGDISGATARPLVTGDELRRTSGATIYAVIDQLAPAQVSKLPYFEMGLDADPNPYYKPKPANENKTTLAV